MKKQKKQPYIGIIDLKAEQKEYENLCNGKSKKFQTYTSWEKHIKTLLQNFNSPIDLYNFKRYCINQDRVFSSAPNLFGSYVLLLITLVLEKIFSYLSIFWLLTLVLFFTWHGVSQHKAIIKGSCFFKDIVEIIEKIEKENLNHDQESGLPTTIS